MGNREEALRRIFDATGVGARLTDDQKRELLGHLEDAVERKVGAGVPEMDAVGQAFSELGDLEKIARQFPEKPAVVTPEGVRVLTDSRPYAWMSLCFLVFFYLMGTFVAPKFMEIFRHARVPLPGLTVLFLNVCGTLQSAVGMTISILLLGLLIVAPRRVRIPQPILSLILIGTVTVCLGLLLSLFLPLVSLLEGVGAARR